MIKLFDLKKKEADEKKDGDAGKKKVAAGLIRMQKDISELKLEKGVEIEFPNGKEDLMYFKVKIKPDSGMYKGGCFVFSFTISDSYPHEAPKVKCETQVYHPNIDMQGAVCLNILREDWKPVLTVQSIIMGLQFLMYDPNPDDPLNKEAADDLVKDKANFERKVRQTLRGMPMTVGTQRYEFPRFIS